MKLETYRKFNGVQFILDELSTFGMSKTDAEKRKAMWKKSGYRVRAVKNSKGKFIIYREYPKV
ncbi:MAG: hypothetical protein M0R51_11550 [Clostridia bacterium]|jgi:hypothetical protein|nr:hypothetical protein [Clostridia bacterium]